MQEPFRIVALTPAGQSEPTLVLAADRASCLGVLNAEIGPLPLLALERLAGKTRSPFGLKLRQLAEDSIRVVEEFAPRGLGWLTLDASFVLDNPETLARLADLDVRVIVEAIEWDDRLAGLAGHAALQVKGHEAGGLVGEETSFILLQKALRRQAAPVFVRGGIGLHSAAAVRAAGAAGIVLDDQLLLLKESSVADSLRRQLADFSGLETGLISAGGNWRVFDKPGFRHIRQLKAKLAGMQVETAGELLAENLGWMDPASHVVPLGQAAAFAAPFAERYGTFGRLAQALLSESERRLEQVVALNPLGPGHGVAGSHGTIYPIVQGPMTRVSDVAGFAQAVADAGALPMLALALMQPEQVDTLLAETTARLAGKPWGVGLLGFAPADLIHAQTEVARSHAPRFALIAGGRPDQARALEADGVTSYLHVPSPRLLTMFLEQGATRFVLEGRECGGHVGPLSSFVLWDVMVSTLLANVKDSAQAGDIHILFAGGVHDALSAAMVATVAAPLAERGIKVGVLAGTAYLFSKEIVETGAIVRGFQNAALACDTTVTLETGPGHASRAATSPFADAFLARRRELEAKGTSGDDIRQDLESFTLGSLRLASKGQERAGPDARLRRVPEARQKREGMFMIGQVATLRDEVVDIADLHHDISEGSHALLAERLRDGRQPAQARAARPADIAVIGLGAILPKAGDVSEYWENILDRRDAIDEIPAHRWDWRLYFDADRTAPDRIYSRWGGFLDDLLFDPVRYGIPPRALESVDPLQLMTLEVVRRCLADAGLENLDGSRERMSIILGASGGTGDVGAQYAVRSEMPRFAGELDSGAAERLPKWTEDFFAGILLNVAAGRSANRFDMGGVNYTVDAACASSLAAIYQAVLELESGRSDLVLAGGVDTVQGPFGYLCFSKTQALSPRGRCRAFDSTADGIVISEGIAILALKRLADAERDGDRIYAVLKGVGGSSDGKAKSMTAPHPDGQIRALTRAYEMAGYSPASVGLFEAHGTGTVAGDTAELETVTRLLNETGTSAHRHVIGSVKTLIGHTKATAGAAGLIKAVLALHNKVLPPHGSFDVPNARLSDPSSPLYLVKDAHPWIADTAHPRRASVSAFGFGGTNFHVTLEEHQDGGFAAPPTPRSRWPKELLVWRGADRAEIAAAVRKLATRLSHGARPELRDLAFTLARQAPKTGLAATLVVRRDEPLGERIGSFADALESPERPLPPGAAFSEHPLIAAGGKLAMIFPGQGSQYPEMLRDLAVMFPEMRSVIEAADRILADRMHEKAIDGGLLSKVIFPPGVYDDAARELAVERLTRTDLAQPALGAIEAGLLGLLRSFGVGPDLAAGHSYGEFVALYAAGVLDLDELLTVSEARGRFMLEAAAEGDLGTMTAVRAERSVVEAAIEKIPDVVIANHNMPSQTVLSGTRQAIEQASAALAAAGVACQHFPVGAAFHSPIVAPARDRLAAFVAALPLRPAKFPVFANTSASAYPSDPEGIRAVLCEQIVRPVEFVREIEAMHDAGARIFLTVGPKGSHAGMVRQILEARPHRAIAIDDCDGGFGSLLFALGGLLAEGANVDLDRLWAGRDCRMLDAGLGGANRQPEAAPHMWWLNGGGARRVGAPAPQPLTIEETVLKRRAVTDFAAPAAPQSEPQPQPAATPAAPPGNGARRKLTLGQRQMDPNERIPAGQGAASAADYAAMGEREAALVEFQATMQRFLEAQESVMLAYLSGGAPAGRVARPAIAAREPAPTRVAHAPVRSIAPPLPAPAYRNGSGGAAHLPPATAAAAPAMPPAQPKAAPVASPIAVPAQPAQAPAPHVNGVRNGVASVAAPLPQAAAAANGNGKGVGRPALTDLLLGLVEDRTGYPRDMLGMDQNLEADLGIDSIKRVEIVGALIKALPADAQPSAATLGEALNSQKTLNGIVDCLWQQIGSAAEVAPRPFDQAGADLDEAVSARPPRFVMAAHAEAFPDRVVPTTLPAGLFILTDDGTGIAPALARLIEAAGGMARVVGADPARAEAGITEALSEIGVPPLAGFVHLAPAGARPLALADEPSLWCAELLRNEALPHRILGRLHGDLEKGGKILLVSGLGGLFGRGASTPQGIFAQGGGPGLAKSLKEEWPLASVKAVDLDTSLSAEANARVLFNELAIAGGRLEVGYPRGRRTIFRTEPAPLPPGAPIRHELPERAVLLATGGARGITAEALRPLARPGVTLVLAGRTPLPAAEDPRFASISTSALRAALIQSARAASETPTPAEIERKLQALIRDREIRANLADFEAAGAKVAYRVADLRQPDQASALIAGIHEEFGRLDGIIHGAGLIEDKLIVDKDPASWARVVETKALSAFAIARAVRPESLGFFILFGSVAGRYGNSGQSDYAAANELLNRFALQLRGEWPESVKIAVLNWGPWEGTRHGPGMVSAETRRKFEAKRVGLVQPEGGAAACLDEILRGPVGDVEIILGDGPWERQEAEQGRFLDAPAKTNGAAAPTSPWPLVAHATGAAGPRGGRLLVTTLSLDNDLYLDHHRLDGVPVLPAAVALEMAAEAAATVWPGWHVSEVSDLKLLNGLRLEDDRPRALEIVVVGSEHGDATGFNATVELRSAGEAGRPHYRASVRLTDMLPSEPAPDWAAGFAPAAAPLSAGHAYRSILSHGPILQAVSRLVGLDETGVLADMAPSTPSSFVHGASANARWLFDPALVDAAAQIAWLWSCRFRDAVALPNRFGRIRRFADAGPARRMLFAVEPGTAEHEVRADVLVVDDAARPVFVIENLESTASVALNRFRGWTGEIRV